MTETSTTTKKAPAKKTIKAAKAPVSLEATIYSQKATKAGTISLPAKVFGLKWNADLVHEVVTGMMANKRSGTAHSKDRSEVSGGGIKPWKQKGTGRSRHGSSRSPIWRHGGVTFGPRNDKDYSKKINKKTRVKALFTLLSHKYALGSTLFVDSLSLDAIKTKNANSILSSWKSVDGFAGVVSKKPTSTLLVMAETNAIIEKSFANLPGVTLTKVADLNALMLTNFRHIIFVNPAAAIAVLEAKMK